MGKKKIPVFQAYLGKEGLVDLHALVRALQQHLLAAAPAVAHGRVGVGHAPEEHGLLIIKLLLGLPDALVDRDDGIVQIWGKTAGKNINLCRVLVDSIMAWRQEFPAAPRN